MKQKIYFAQKGLIFDEKQEKILLIKYSLSKFASRKLVGKYGLPGGKLEFGEQLDDAFVREIRKETGVIITPKIPFYTWSWIYEKGNETAQIVANARIGFYKSGEIIEPNEEAEVEISKASWINISDLRESQIVRDEWIVIQKFFEYRKSNPLNF